MCLAARSREVVDRACFVYNEMKMTLVQKNKRQSFRAT